MVNDRWRMFRTTAKKDHFLRGILLSFIALVCLLIPIFARVDEQGWFFSLAFFVFAGALAAYNFHRARRAKPESVVYLHPEAAPPNLRVKMYRKMIWATAIAFPILTAISAWDLRQLETGENPHARVWAPLALIYERFGYWPTVALLPILGVVCIGVFIYSIRKSRRME